MQSALMRANIVTNRMKLSRLTVSAITEIIEEAVESEMNDDVLNFMLELT